MPKYLILNAGFVNKGAEAMLKTVRQELMQRIPNAQFCVDGSRMPPAEITHCRDAGLIPMTGPSQFHGKELWKYRLYKMQTLWMHKHRGFPPAASARAWKQVMDVEGVLDASGYAYGDSWGHGNAFTTAQYVRLCNKAGKPFVFLPQAWGPFGKNNRLIKAMDYLLHQATGWYARDRHSASECAKVASIPLSQVCMSPDIAFLFHSTERPENPHTGKRVGIVPNMRVYEKTPGIGSQNQYIALLSELSRKLQQAGYEVALLPHEIVLSHANVKPRYPDDRLLCDMVRYLSDQGKVVSFMEDMTAEKIKDEIAQCEVLVSSRFHSIVASLSQNIPVLAISWSHKYGELLQEFGLEDFVYDARDTSAEDLFNKVETLYHSRKDFALSARATHMEIKKALSQVFDQVAEWLTRSNHRPSSNTSQNGGT